MLSPMSILRNIRPPKNTKNVKTYFSSSCEYQIINKQFIKFEREDFQVFFIFGLWKFINEIKLNQMKSNQMISDEMKSNKIKSIQINSNQFKSNKIK